jgi:hypothetical protein
MDTPRQRQMKREARRAFKAFLEVPSAYNYAATEIAMQDVQEARNERNALLEAQRAE